LSQGLQNNRQDPSQLHLIRALNDELRYRAAKGALGE
jgi:hypothetical protein